MVRLLFVRALYGGNEYCGMCVKSNYARPSPSGRGRREAPGEGSRCGKFRTLSRRRRKRLLSAGSGGLAGARCRHAVPIRWLQTLQVVNEEILQQPLIIRAAGSVVA